MNDFWQPLLSQAGVTFSPGGAPTFASADTSKGLLVSPLLDRDFIELSGEGSKKFLQGQTTCNIDNLSEHNWLRGAICDPKGRMITSFSLYQLSTDKLLMEMHQGLADITLQAVKKFSVFFKTTLENATGKYASIGLLGEKAVQAVARIFNREPQEFPGALVHQDCLAASLSEQQIKLLAPVDKLPALWQQLVQLGTLTSQQAWDLTAIRQGIGHVTPETSGELIPQMMNLEAIGGVSFKKGCYTGQEIVARMQYLGKLKRRMYRVEIPGGETPRPGEPCFAGEHSSNQGEVVNAIKIGESIEALLVMTQELKQAEQIKIGVQPLSAFKVLPLPYDKD